MFTMSKVKDSNTTGNTFMFDHLSCNDYYSENEKVTGHWHGKLAEKFNVSGTEILPSEFTSIQENVNPWIGGKLTPAVRKGSSRFFDFQCSAQKSVSIMSVVMNDHRLAEAHTECVKEALDEMEKFVSCRIRKGQYKNSNELETTGSMIAGLYNHDASRALDPQIHTHCVVANVTWSESEKRFKALSEHEILKAIRYCGKYYQNLMAHKVQELGYDIELKRTEKGIEGFEIKGVDQDLLERYSRRRAEIEKEIEAFRSDHGREPTAAEIHVIAKETREAKLKEITTPEVLAAQRKMLSEEELAKLRAIKYQALKKDITKKEMLPGQISQILGKTIDHLYERKSVITGHEILAEALNQGLGKTSAEQLKKALHNNRELLPLTKNQNSLQDLYVTRRGLALESGAVNMANEGLNQFEELGDFNQADTEKLSEVQRNAVQGVLDNKDFACILRGFAGSGKTTALRPVHSGLVAAGKKPLYLAPTRGAVKVLKDDGFTNATTVAAFMNKPAFEKDTVLIVDESSLCSAAVGHKLMYLAKQNNSRIVFVGDRRQHLSVEAGDFLRVLEFYSNVKSFELSKIIRQIPERYRDAVQLMAKGKAAAGIEELNKLRAVEERGNAYLAAAANRYVSSVIDGNKTLLVSPTHQEIDTLNTLIREQLNKKEKLNFSEQKEKICFTDYNWSRDQIASSHTYKPGYSIRFNSQIFGTNFKKHDIYEIDSIDEKGNLVLTSGDIVSPSVIKNNISVGLQDALKLAPGDQILITANHKEFDLTNGDTAEVKEISDSGEITLTDGRIIPADFKSISYGYATTSHKSQGATCDHAILAAAAMDDRACYVGSSRGRQSVKIFCPDFEHLTKSIKRNSEHLTGHDLIAAREDHFNELQEKGAVSEDIIDEEQKQGIWEGLASQPQEKTVPSGLVTKEQVLAVPEQSPKVEVVEV